MADLHNMMQKLAEGPADYIERSARYSQLKTAQKYGAIKRLRKGHRFTLEDNNRELVFTADFTYYLGDGAFRLPVGEILNLSEWTRGLGNPNTKRIIIEAGKVARKQDGYQLMKHLMAAQGYIVLEVA